MSHFVPIPHKAIDAVDFRHWSVVAALYKQAHEERWSPVWLTEIGLAAMLGTSQKAVRLVIEALVAEGLASVERHDSTITITLFDPTQDRAGGGE